MPTTQLSQTVHNCDLRDDGPDAEKFRGKLGHQNKQTMKQDTKQHT